MQENSFQQLLKNYLNFEVEGKRVKIPYVLERSRWAFGKSSGKGTPDVLLKELTRAALKQGFDLGDATESQIYDFMRRQRIGVECSGLVFHLLSALVREQKGIELSKALLRYPGVVGQIERFILQFQRYRRINARVLTSDLNTIEVVSVSEINIGDMIRMSVKKVADHVLLIVAVTTGPSGLQEITYVHSSSVHTRKRGPHTSTITITNPSKGLEAQHWNEVAKEGDSYMKHFHPERGDGVRRLRALTT